MSVAREPLADEGRRVVGSRGFVCAASFALGQDPGNRPVLKPQWPPHPPVGALSLESPPLISSSERSARLHGSSGGGSGSRWHL